MKKRIAILLSLAITFTSFSNIITVFALDSETVKTQTPVQTKDSNYLDYFNELTTFINQKVGDDTSDNSLSSALEDEGFAKSIAQRELLKSAGAEEIQGFTSTPEKKKFIDWLLGSTEAMNLFLEGGKPDTEYSKAFEVWFEIWSKDSDSHSGYELKLAIACALKFGNGVPKWYTSRTLVTPYERYDYFKVREAQGKFPVSMKTRSVWELRNIVDAGCSNWDLDYVREVIHKDRYNEDKQKISISYPPYTSSSINKDENGIPYNVFSSSGDQFFGPNATIKEVHEIGGVCGTASMFGGITSKSFGIPGFLIGQPGHAAHVYHSPTAYGNWDIGYDIFGFGESNHSSHTVIPFTDYKDVVNRVPYLFVYEDARTDEAALHKSFQLKWIADALEDLNKAQSVRKVAMEKNKWNIDIWRDYIGSYEKIWNDGLASTQIPTSNISVTATSANSNTPPENVNDGSNTIWHTKYDGERSVLPQSITLELDKIYEISRFSYMPRQDGGRNGNITEYNLYISSDGVNYELISNGVWKNNSSEKIVDFKTVNAKYIKLEALQGERNYASASELKVYEAYTNKPITQDQWDEVAYDIINNLSEEPQVVYDLFRSIQSHVLNSEISREKYQKYIVDLNAILDKYSAENSKAKQVADSLKNIMIQHGLSLADFNFDGENGGRLLGSKMDSEYSLDGGETFKAITEENMKLSQEEIASITPENGIRIRIVGTNEYVLIPIYKEPSLPNIYANDDINKIFNMNDKLYYSVDDGNTWTKYVSEDNLPDISKDVDLMVRIPAQGKTLGSEIQTFNFTSKVDTSLILPSNIANVKGEGYKNNPVEYAYDGDINSFWHSDYEGEVKPLPKSIIFELKDVTNLYKIEYIPRQDGGKNGNITNYNIYTSVDGVKYDLVSNGKWADDSSTKTATFNAANVRFMKFEAVKGVGNYGSAAEIKLYKTDVLIPQISFNLDGENAGKLMGTNGTMEYTMDNGTTWKNITEVNMALSSEESSSINPNTIIKVRFKNADKAAEISFAACSKNPDVEGNDSDNSIIGLDNTMEYSTDDGITWNRYNGAFNEELRGNITVHVRTAATGTTLPGCDVVFNYTAEFENDFKEGVTYKFISKATGKTIDVAGGSGAEDAEVIQYGYGGSSNQIGYFQSVGENQYKIIMKTSGKVLSPQGLSSSEGAKLTQTTYNGANNQKWKLVKLGNNEYQIINVGTGYALTADKNRSDLKNNKFNNSNNQIWSINYVHDVVVPEVNFSFDGENQGRIIGADKTMEYTLDNGATWNKIKETNILLIQDDLNKINAQFGIKVRVKDNAGIAEIKINNRAEKPAVSANDNLNIIEGINTNMEYSLDRGTTWTRYSEDNIPKFMSDVIVLVRVAGMCVTPPSENIELNFTGKITIPLYKEFAPIDYITAKDSEGNDITGSVKVIGNTVDINKKGIYLVTYTATDANNIETTATKEVEVVSSMDYLSDINYKSGTCGWGSIKKDKNLNSNVNNGSIVLHSNIGEDIFKKGLTAHANSEIVYDISKKEYTNFESYVGLDDTSYNSGASVIFKVFVDGVLKYDSGIVSSKDPYKYVDVDIKDGKEIKLVVDSNGSATSDHSVWADAKFISRNAKPIINGTNVAYEKDEVVNFDEIIGKVTASDIEDGDLTSKITYTTNYIKGATGNFDIIYSVTDSDGNQTQKSVKIIVVNSSIYASDTDWVKATSGWSSVKKDKTISDSALRLWNGENEVTYKKGIGTHAYSEVIYDLTGKDYGYFTSYVGADRGGNWRTSINFKVYLDGNLVKETNIMNKDTAQEFIKVNIGGAKEMKLVVEDGGNGNGNDGAIWGDAKFLYADKTIINVDTSKLTEAVKQAELLNESDYESPSWKVLSEKIKESKNILNDEKAVQDDVDKSYDAIIEAITNLQKFKGQSPVINGTDVVYNEGDSINFDDILAKVTATDPEDGDISSKITYTTNYVENGIGDFEIVYTVVDSHGNITTQTIMLTVNPTKDKFAYISDINWESAMCGWGEIKKDTNLNNKPIVLKTNNGTETFKKGIAAHATSEIVYNIENLGYKTFQSYIGIENSAAVEGNVIFKVYIDGVEKYNSGKMRTITPYKEINLDIEGAKEIKLVVSSNGRNYSDHSVWADAKLIF